jgi:outer membrane protein insertion porin family
MTFAVTPGPTLALEVRGDPLPDPRLKSRLFRLIREGGAEGDALEEGRDLVERALLDRGHRQAVVSYRTEEGPRGEAIVYEVKAGPAAIVESVRVSADAESGLEAGLLTRPGLPLRDRTTEEDARTLTRTLEDRGYPEARVQAEVPDGGGRVEVVFRVQEGPRVIVSGVHIDTPVPLPADAEPRELRLRAGQPYRVRDLARDRMSVLSAYRDGGYPDADVVPTVTRSGDGTGAAVTLEVVPGRRVDVDHLVVAGLEHTKETVVRRELTLKEGEPLGLDRLLESQRRLAALGIFQRVSVAEIDPESRDQRSLVVQVEEAPRITVAYGIGSAEGDPLRGSVEVTRRNLFGMDRSLSSFARVSFKGSRFLTSYREPFLFGRKQELFVTAFREEEERAFFDFERYGGFVQSARQLRPAWNLIARYTYQRTDAFNITSPGQVGREFAFSTFSGPAGSVVNDTRDDPLDPHRGRFVSADLQFSHKVLGGDSFLKGFVQGALYERLNARTVLAVSGRVGLARTFGLEESIFLPRPDRFYAGGDYSLRGFETDAVDPLGGNALVLAGAELRFDVGKSFQTAVFSDVGNVYELVSELDLSNVRASAGVGVRYRTAFGPVRVDWAFKLNRRQDESASRVHLTIGHAF